MTRTHKLSEVKQGMATSAIVACLAHKNQASSYLLTCTPSTTTTTPGTPYFSASPLSFVLVQQKTPAWPRLSAPTWAHIGGILIWHSDCNVIAIFTKLSVAISGQIHSFTFPCHGYTCSNSMMRCKWNIVNLQAAPELQADLNRPVKEN